MKIKVQGIGPLVRVVGKYNYTMNLLKDETLEELVTEQQSALMNLVKAQSKSKSASQEISMARSRCVEVEAKLRDFKWRYLAI